MANQNRTQQRSSSSPSRFGRTSASSASRGRKPSTRSNAGRSLRAGQGEAGARGRFGLGSSLGPSGGGRHDRTNVSRRPKTKVTPQKSGVSRALSALGSKSGGKAATKASSRSAKPAGFALLAGAAGLALKNRDKLKGLAGRGGSSSHEGSSDFSYGDGSGTGLQAGTGVPAGSAGITEDRVPGSDNLSSPQDERPNG